MNKVNYIHCPDCFVETLIPRLRRGRDRFRRWNLPPIEHHLIEDENICAKPHELNAFINKRNILVRTWLSIKLWYIKKYKLKDIRPRVVRRHPVTRKVLIKRTKAK